MLSYFQSSTAVFTYFSTEDTISKEEIIPDKVVINKKIQARFEENAIVCWKVIFNKRNESDLVKQMIPDFTIHL